MVDFADFFVSLSAGLSAEECQRLVIWCYAVRETTKDKKGDGLKLDLAMIMRYCRTQCIWE